MTVQLQQMLMNLMINSIDAMKTVEGVRHLTLSSELSDDRQLLVSVHDTGSGLPSDQVDQIFTAFFTTKSYGAGMGLSISRSIVEFHGGRLWATNNSGPGACFKFTPPPRSPSLHDFPRVRNRTATLAHLMALPWLLTVRPHQTLTAIHHSALQPRPRGCRRATRSNNLFL